MPESPTWLLNYANVFANRCPKVARNAVVAETVKVVSTSLLGLTVGCAECHNHRYDPIPQTDYYRIADYEVTEDAFPNLAQARLWLKPKLPCDRFVCEIITGEGKGGFKLYLLGGPSQLDVWDIMDYCQCKHEFLSTLQ